MSKWNLKSLYSSTEDHQIEKDLRVMEEVCEEFSKKFDTASKAYMINTLALLEALKEYENLNIKLECKPFLYFNYLRDMDSANNKAASAISLIANRQAKAYNKISFFEISLGTIPKEKQREFLSSTELSKYKVFLGRVFSDAKYNLSVPEEKIMNLKSLPAREMWIDGNERALGQLSIKWKGKTLPLPKAQKLIHTLVKVSERYKVNDLVTEQLKSIAPFSEAEINAVYTDKKINDELRGYVLPYENTVRSYRNDPTVVKKLVETVTTSFPISHRFYKIKAKLLKLKKLRYTDRMADVGKIKSKFNFVQSLDFLKKTFGKIDKKYADILERYSKQGQIDALPKVGKKGGAYCWGSYSNPTFVLLNHTDDLNSLTTFAHEMGHAFHTELSRQQGIMYYDYSTSLAETASTLFESIAIEAVFDSLSEKEKITVLHDRINDAVSTIFRQVACFNFESDLHNNVRSKGFASKEEIAELHNENMKAYLGPVFEMKPDDGYFFTQWGHIRRFFYVYSYAYGMLVSKALLRRYRADKTFWKSIEKFLSAGGKASPEEILLEIGIDVSKPEFWQEGLKEIEADIKKLENLVNTRAK